MNWGDVPPYPYGGTAAERLDGVGTIHHCMLRRAVFGSLSTAPRQNCLPIVLGDVFHLRGASDCRPKITNVMLIDVFKSVQGNTVFTAQRAKFVCSRGSL